MTSYESWLTDTPSTDYHNTVLYNRVIGTLILIEDKRIIHNNII